MITARSTLDRPQVIEVAGQHVELAAGRIEQHTDLEAAGADGRASLPDAGDLFVEVAVEPDVHAVGVGERHLDRRPRRCPDHDRWDGRAVDDVAQTVGTTAVGLSNDSAPA